MFQHPVNRICRICAVYKALTIYCGKYYSLHDNPNMMAGGQAEHEQQTISSTTVLITRTFCMENEKHLTPRGQGACQRYPSMQVSHGEANFILTFRNYITFTPGSFGVQPCTAPCSSSSTICAAPFGAGEHLQFCRTTNGQEQTL